MNVVFLLACWFALSARVHNCFWLLFLCMCVCVWKRIVDFFFIIYWRVLYCPLLSFTPFWFIIFLLPFLPNHRLRAQGRLVWKWLREYVFFPPPLLPFTVRLCFVCCGGGGSPVAAGQWFGLAELCVNISRVELVSPSHVTPSTTTTARVHFSCILLIKEILNVTVKKRLPVSLSVCTK